MALVRIVLPGFLGAGLVGLILSGPGDPRATLCHLLRARQSAQEYCLAIPHLALWAWAVALGLVGLTILLVWQWRRARRAAITYRTDARRWIVLGWVLAIGGAISLLAGLALIGSGGWPFSQHSRNIRFETGKLPVAISPVQRRYFSNYSGFIGGRAVSSQSAGFGDVTIANRSRDRRLSLDLGLRLAGRIDGVALPDALAGPFGTQLGRDDMAAIAVVRRGFGSQAFFGSPVELEPRQSATKELVFVFRVGTDALRNALADLMARDRDTAFILDVTDRLTGDAIAMTLPAEYRG